MSRTSIARVDLQRPATALRLATVGVEATVVEIAAGAVGAQVAADEVEGAADAVVVGGMAAVAMADTVATAEADTKSNLFSADSCGY